MNPFFPDKRFRSRSMRLRAAALLVGLVTAGLVLAGCDGLSKSPAEPTHPAAPAVEAALEPLTFMAGYKPQANLPFVGVYLAKEKGFFEAEGLDVTIEHSPGQGQHLQLVASGKVAVTTQDAAILLRRRYDPGLPLVSIALIGQRGQQAFAALESSGMESPKDWEGKLVGYKGTPPPELFATIGAAGADLERIELVNVGFDPRLLAEGKVDVYPVFNSNEPYLLESWGFDLVLWQPEDFGVPSLGLAYVTSEETLKNRADALTRFLRAALQGIEYARANPDEAVEVVGDYAGPETDPEHMRFMLATELADAESELTRQNGTGWQSAEQWQSLAEMLAQYEVLGEIDPALAFTNQILEAARLPAP
ncbi:MAG TPA: ABC transporter substrate-binding protein [Anaerolineaceae bacterium]|nr:ABC transporter substrate-binding protein [Anaerolineaceae bacterium]